MEISNDKSRIERVVRTQLLSKCDKAATHFTNDFVESFVCLSQLQFYHKNDELGKMEDRQNQLYYINSGIAHTFYYSKNREKPVVTNIWTKDQTIFDLNTFLNGVEKQEITEMLEDGEILSIPFDALRQLLETYPLMVGFFLSLQAEREKQYKYYQSLLRLNVSQKVLLYLSDHPAMVHRVNNEIIAAHLGVSRSRFSKAYALYKHSASQNISI